MNPDWLEDFTPAIQKLPQLCEHFYRDLAQCNRHTCIVLQGTYENHLRAVRLALERTVQA